MSTIVIMISGRQHKRGRMPSTKRFDGSDNRNTTRIRVSAGNKDTSVAADKAIADAYSKRFYIPLDFDLLESHMPFYQSALGDRLEYEFTFNDYNRVIWATGETSRTSTWCTTW